MPISVATFVERLEQSGIVDETTLDAIRSEAGPDKDPQRNGESFVRRLVRSELLTGYQARKIWKGRQDELVYGNYVVLDELGRGGMGVVLKAQHRRMQRLVALKILPRDIVKDQLAVQRFQREVIAAAQLEHPNIVAAHDADEVDGTHLLVMQFVDGRDLSTLVKENGPFSVEQAIDIVRQAALGLDYAHGRGVIHRDIKPSNLLLDSDGCVKILDMGLARFESSANVATQAELTSTGAVMGTVDYMSPEQALSTRTADARSDQYSLGMTFFYLLTAKPAYVGDTVTARLLAHQNAPIPKLSEHCEGVPANVDELFAKIAAKTPEERFSSMKELADALAALEVEEPAEVARAAANTTIGFGGSGILDSMDHSTAGDTRTVEYDNETLPASDTDVNAHAQTFASDESYGTEGDSGEALPPPSGEHARVPPPEQSFETTATRAAPVQPEWLERFAHLPYDRRAQIAFVALLVFTAAVVFWPRGSSRRKDDGSTPLEELETTVDPKSDGTTKGTPSEWVELVTGPGRSDWEEFGGGTWKGDEFLVAAGDGVGWLGTRKRYENFELELQYKLPVGGKSGVLLRADPGKGGTAFEVQLIDDAFFDVSAEKSTAALYDRVAPRRKVVTTTDTWNRLRIRLVDRDLQVWHDDELVLETLLIGPGPIPESGRIGLQMDGTRAEFSRLRVRTID